MNYDIYHSSITYFPLLPLSKSVSFERNGTGYPTDACSGFISSLG